MCESFGNSFVNAPAQEDCLSREFHQELINATVQSDCRSASDGREQVRIFNRSISVTAY